MEEPGLLLSRRTHLTLGINLQLLPSPSLIWWGEKAFLTVPIHHCLAKALGRELLGRAQKSNYVLGHPGTPEVSVVGTYWWGGFLQGNEVPPACGTSASTLQGLPGQLRSHFWRGLLIWFIYLFHFLSSKLEDLTSCLTATGEFRLNSLELIRLIDVRQVNGPCMKQSVIWIFFGSGRG